MLAQDPKEDLWEEYDHENNPEAVATRWRRVGPGPASRRGSEAAAAGGALLKAPALEAHEMPPSLPQLYIMHDVHKELRARLHERRSAEHLARTLLEEGRLSYVFNCSGPYVQLHGQNTQHLAELRARRPDFASFLQEAEASIREEKDGTPLLRGAEVSLASLLMQARC